MHQGPGVTDTTHQLPVFALPEFTLFKGTLVPFHIFEPGYCEMIERCLADRRLLVVAGLQPGWEAYEPQDEAVAPVYDIGGLGRVVSDRRFPDGRWNIFVHCIERVCITDRMAAKPGWTHPVVDVSIIADVFEADGGARLAIAGHRMQTLARSLALELGPEGAALSKVLGSTDDPGVLSNRLASLIVRHPDERQQLLEELSPLRRCAQLAEIFGVELMGIEEPTTASGWVN
jgi:Lon protease-like protein